jgi:hypothetical protein
LHSEPKNEWELGGNLLFRANSKLSMQINFNCKNEKQ